MGEGARAKGKEVSYPLICLAHRHFGMARKRQTRNLEIPQCAIVHSGSMLRAAPARSRRIAPE
jgi:D-alanyl-D-alanine dipeptidase